MEGGDTSHFRREALVFEVKSRLFQIKRALGNAVESPPLHRSGNELLEAPVCGEHVSFLWSVAHPAEMDLAAGKVQNLRVACRKLDGLEVRAGEIFSFWRQVGRTSRWKGYVRGRELREGCLIPNIGGGLCQLSNGLYDAALKAGFEIVERHAHSRVVAGSLAEEGRDATVFWNYVDLRIRAEADFRIECRLTKDQLVIRFRSPVSNKRDAAPASKIQEADVLGNCLTCNHPTCFRSEAKTIADVKFGRKAFLLDAWWPEHDDWCRENLTGNARVLVTLDGKKRDKPNYAWTLPHCQEVGLLLCLRRAWELRRLPRQGAALQSCLLDYDRRIASTMASKLTPEVSHCVVSQNLLPHLWQSGALGGRTFDVLITRWPLRTLQRILDGVARNHPDCDTPADFRAPADLVEAEEEALRAAQSLITPHRAIAGELKSRNNRVVTPDWQLPAATPRTTKPVKGRYFFPASPLPRKGSFLLGKVLEGLEVELPVLGKARDGAGTGLETIPNQWRAVRAEMDRCEAVILPAYVENQPRILLEAIAKGIPVIASRACGLEDLPGLTVFDNAEELAGILGELNESRAFAPAC